MLIVFFFTGCDPESNIYVWLYHTAEEKDYKPRLNRSNIDVFPLAEKDSLPKIMWGYTLKNALADTKGLHYLKRRQYIVLKTIFP